MADPNTQQPVNDGTMIDQPTGATPNPATAAPAAPNAPNAPATPTTPAPPVPGAAAPAPPQPQHPVMRVMDSILKGATGGDVYYTDENGQRKLAPQSRGTLGKTLIAATLAGLLAPDKYVQTPYGPRRDFTGSAGSAMEASQGVINNARQQPQKLSNEAQARKMLTLQNNSQLVGLQAAQARLASEANDYRVKTAAHVDDMFSPFKEYEEQRTGNNDPSQPKAFIDGGRGLDHEQAMAMIQQKGNGLTENNIIQDGWVDKWDEAAGRMIPEPTYAILNPELKDVKLPKNVADVLASINSQYKDIHQKVGGDLKIPVNAYVSAMHDYQAVLTGQQALDQINTAIGGKTPITLEQVEKAARDGRAGGANILPALYSLTHAIAGGQVPDQRADNLLDTILKAPNGAGILQLLGLTPAEAAKKAEDISNQRISANKLAQEGGMGEHAPAAQDQVQRILDNVNNNPDLTPTDRKTLLANVPTAGKDGQIHWTQGQAEKVLKDTQEIVKTNKDNALKAGDPAQIAETVDNWIEGDVSSVKDLVSATRSNPTLRAQVNNKLQDEARRRGLDPIRYTVEAQQARADLYKQYAEPNQKIGSQLNSFGTLLGHIANGYDASENWARSNNPLVAHGIGWLDEHAANDQDYQRFKDSIIAPAKEYMTFLNNGNAEQRADGEKLEKVIDPASTPATALTALTEFARTADIRAANLGQAYLRTVGTTYPVVNSTGEAILDRLLGKGKSQAVAVSQTIPRGWQNHQPSTPDQKTLMTILAAAGNDPVAATRIAKENGWQIPQ